MGYLYCTDEDIVIIVDKQWRYLTGDDNRLCYGVDGFIDPDAPWELQSVGVDFAARGLAGGHVISLAAPSAPDAFSPDGENLVISGVLPDIGGVHRLQLRRLGQLDGIGDPPGYKDTYTENIIFVVYTATPTIATVSSEIEATYGILDPVTGEAQGSFLDLVPVRIFATYRTIGRRLMARAEFQTDPVGRMQASAVGKRFADAAVEFERQITIRYPSGAAAPRPASWSRIFR